MAEKTIRLMQFVFTRVPSLLSPFILLLVFCFAFNCCAADLAQTRATFYRGEYNACIELAQAEVDKGIWNDAWSRQLIECLLVTGQYAEACEAYEKVADRFSTSIPLRVLAARAYRFAGQHEKGDRLLKEIVELVQNAPWRFSDRENMLAIGRYLLSIGEDARAVLSSFYDYSLKSDPKFVDAHVAIAELALEKADYQEAVKSLDVAVDLRPDDPEIHYLLARAWAPSEPDRAAEQLDAALKLNPRHLSSLLMVAERMIDSESYDEAREVLEKIFQVNPTQPSAWSLLAAIEHLRGNYRQEGECRSKALATWAQNPEVDYLVGKVLSQHYRFEESVKYQRRALRLSPTFTAAKFQLAQDLLRVGLDDEGWTIVDQVADADKYNVVAFNLKTLQERLSQFATLQEDGFIVRMDARESRIYGGRVLQLLKEAKQVLATKYEHELREPVTVEIFPQQSDFAIRTFGLPGGAGFLGVCFGSLITANSPASQGESPSNWESVLWHEFCHVITLQKTNNRMPRWLSEGISVYEEIERDASWGQSLSPMYKDMLLGEDFVPLSQLSSAFLNPKSPLHLQFAYFESSLAVRYLVTTQGLPLLRKLLVDLGAGIPLEEAFERRYGDTEKLDKDFREYIEKLAKDFLPETDFDRDGLSPQAGESAVDQWLSERPQSYYAQRLKVEFLIKQKKWPEALKAARKLKLLYPQDAEAGGALDMLARIARETQDKQLEIESLEQMVSLSSDNVPALLRLTVLCREAKSWEALAKYSSHLLAVQPLIPSGHEAQIDAARHLNQPDLAVPSLAALKEMEPLDPAGLHFQSAEMLFAAGKVQEARIEAILALEFTPRYRAAQQLLKQIYARLHATENEGHASTTLQTAQATSTEPLTAETIMAQPIIVASPDSGTPPKP